MKKAKKLLSVILSVCMILTAIGAIAPITASAATYFDGSSAMSIANNDKDNDGELCLVMTKDVAGIGGKAADDVIYKIEINDLDNLSDAYVGGYQSANGQKYLVSYDMYMSAGAKVFWELWTYDDSAYSAKTNTKGIYISPADGVVFGSADGSVDADIPEITPNQWHNFAIEIVGDGTTDMTIYIDGVAYPCTLPKAAYGTYCMRSHYSGDTVYLDNYSYTVGATDADLYDEASYVMSDISVAESEKVTYDADAKQFTMVDNTLTAAEFKALITSNYNVNLYDGVLCQNELADDALVTVNTVVCTSNGDKSYRIYDFSRENNTIFEYAVNSDGISVTVTGFKADSVPAAGSALEIPALIAGYPVTAIGNSAFRVGTGYLGVKLSSVTMPDTVKTIGSNAFKDTYASVTAWPSALETVGEYAFVHGGSMPGIFPSGLKSIGKYAFQFANIGKTDGAFVLPDGLETIGEAAFFWCGAIVNFEIPDSVTSLGDYVTQTSYGIETLRFPRNESITEIPAGTLNSSYTNRNDRLFISMDIYIPETITTIPDGLLTNFADGANVKIYGVYGSAAYEYYLKIKAALEEGTYTNLATYPDSGSGWANDEDADGDGKGELASISFVEYDFENDVGFDTTGINMGTTAPGLGTVTNDTTITANVAGVGGKVADDVVLELDTMGGSGGQNFIAASGGEGASRTGVFYHEISVQAPSAGSVGVQYGTYSTADLNDDPDGDGVKDGYYNKNSDAFTLTNNVVYVNGTKVMDAEAGRWYTFATVIPCDGSKNMTVYVNGTKYDTELDEVAYGVRHFRVYPYTNDTRYYVHYDNFRTYRSTTRNYNILSDKPATVTSNSDAITVYNKGIIYADEAATYTAGELKAMLKTDSFSRANVRIYSDKTYTTELSDTDTVTNGSVVVVAATNGFGIERVYSYYPVNPPINTTIYAITIIDEAAKTAAVTGFNEENLVPTDDLSAIAIPEKIMGYTITEIASNAFYKNTEIQSVVLPDTITKIGSNAFANTQSNGTAYGNITSVKLPANLKEIGTGAFQCNNSLTQIELPDGLETIGASAFYWTGLKSISIPNSVTSIGSQAFRLTSSLKYLKLPAGVTEYTNQFYSNSLKLEEIVIPASVTSIGDLVFTDLTKYEMDPVVYGIEGTYAEEYAEANGWEFVNIVANTIVASSGIYGNGSKELAGTDYDIKYGYENLTFKGNLVNIGSDDRYLTITISLCDEAGNSVASTSKDVTVPAESTVVIDEASGISIPVEVLKDKYKVSVTVVQKSDSAAVVAPIEFTFSTDKKEIHVLHIANSFGNDSFSHIRSIAAEDGVVLKVQNMYIGGAKVTQHYKNMLTDAANYTPVINMSYGDTKITVKEALLSDKWDVVALQCASHGQNSNDFAFIDYETWADDAKGTTTGTPNITSEEIFTYIKEYVDTYAPDAKQIMHMSWGPCEAESREIYNARFADEEAYPDASAALFEAQKAAYEYAASIYSDEDGQMVPSSIAIQYALNTFGYQEHSGPITGEKYNEPVAGEISIYRDETCHLTDYGKIIAGLTWYEYLTGNDVTKNTYQKTNISAETMAQLKEAAHYANTQVVPITGSVEEEAEPEVKVSVVNGSANVLVNGEDKGSANTVANYPIGTVLTFTAVPADENSAFMYWYDVSNNTIISSNETIELTVGSNVELKAIFADKAENEIYVTFKANNKVIASGLKDSIEIPANPYIAGYTFGGWYVDGAKVDATLDVESNTVYTAGFIADTTKYDITISGANEQGGQFAYNEKITVTAAGEDGKVFTYWTRDNKIVSYSETYSFYVSGATEVSANYADEAAQAQVVLVMAEPVVVDGDKIGFYAERNVPEEYTIIESGIIVSRLDSFNLSTAGVLKGKATNTSNIGQYTVRKANVSAGDTWNAKAYLIYTDGAQTYTVYSNQVTKTL